MFRTLTKHVGLWFRDRVRLPFTRSADGWTVKIDLTVGNILCNLQTSAVKELPIVVLIGEEVVFEGLPEVLPMVFINRSVSILVQGVEEMGDIWLEADRYTTDVVPRRAVEMAADVLPIFFPDIDIVSIIRRA